MAHLYIFYVDGWLDTVCEDEFSADKAEQYLLTRHNNVELISVLAPVLDDAWLATNHLSRVVKPNNTYWSGRA